MRASLTASGSARPRRYRYQNNNMADLEAKLKEAQTPGSGWWPPTASSRWTAPLPTCAPSAAWRRNTSALVMVDDSHAVGFLGRTGRGTPEHHQVMGRIDLLTGTLGKALGGASGGYTSGRKELIELLRQRSRPYLFSNTLAPPIVGAALKALDLLMASTALRDKLEDNTKFFRAELAPAGSTSCPERTRLSRSCWAMRRWRRVLPTPCWRAGSMSLAFPTRSCPRARPASARRSPPPIRAKTWNALSRRLWKSNVNSAFEMESVLIQRLRLRRRMSN